jgi:hypothetical protein
MAEVALDASESAKAGNSLEKMLCHQTAAMHCAVMKLTARALEAGPPEGRGRSAKAGCIMFKSSSFVNDTRRPL